MPRYHLGYRVIDPAGTVKAVGATPASGRDFSDACAQAQALVRTRFPGLIVEITSGVSRDDQARQ